MSDLGWALTAGLRGRSRGKGGGQKCKKMIVLGSRPSKIKTQRAPTPPPEAYGVQAICVEIIVSVTVMHTHMSLVGCLLTAGGRGRSGGRGRKGQKCKKWIVLGSFPGGNINPPPGSLQFVRFLC